MQTPCLILRLMETRWVSRMTSPRMDTDQQQAKSRMQRRLSITIKEPQLHISQLRTIDSKQTIQYTKCRKHLQRILPPIKTNHTIQQTAKPPMGKPENLRPSKQVALNTTTPNLFHRARQASISRCKLLMARAENHFQSINIISLCSSF